MPQIKRQKRLLSINIVHPHIPLEARVYGAKIRKVSEQTKKKAGKTYFL